MTQTKELDLIGSTKKNLKKIKEIPLLIYFMNEDFGQEVINSYFGNFDEDNDGENFYEVVYEVVEKEFLKGAKKFMPLLKNFNFSYIAIGVDIIGFNCAYACYFPSLSDNKKHNYAFGIGPELLSEYLRKRNDTKYTHNDKMINMWEHEIIHLLDSNNLKKYRFHLNSYDRKEMFMHYIYKMRSEGIANLYDLGKQNLVYNNTSDGLIAFQKEIDRLQSLNWEDISNSKNLTNLILKGFSFYNIGPWLILNHLSNSISLIIKEKSRKWNQKINDGIILTDKEIMEMVEFATNINLNQFGRRLIKSMSQLEHLAKRIELINTPRSLDPLDKEYTNQHTKLTRHFHKLIHI